MFEISDFEKLPDNKYAILQSVVQKLLFLAKRLRPDLQTALSFLCTRVRSPDISDWKKLRRLLQFVRTTLEEKLILSMDGLTFMNTWVDAYYAVHNDMRRHTGGCITLRSGMIHCKSSK